MADLIPPQVRIVITGIVLAALALGVIWYGEWRADAVRAQVTQAYEDKILRLKVDAAKRLAEEVRITLDLERQLNTAASRLEAMGHERKLLSAGYEKRLADLAARNDGRLRDPNATGCRGGGGATAPAAAAGADAGAGDGTEAGGLLSADLSGLLLRLQREADTINDAYAVCRPDALNLRSQLSPP